MIGIVVVGVWWDRAIGHLAIHWRFEIHCSVDGDGFFGEGAGAIRHDNEKLGCDVG